MSILEVQDLVKVYPGGVRAVDGITFKVDEGEIFGFLGPNGAGKTTTIRVIVTLLSPTSGRILVDGLDVREHPEEVRRRIGYAAQFIGIDEDLTAHENLVLQGRLQGLRRRRAEKRAKELLEIVDLSDAANRRARTFSGGMRKRLDLAQALVHEPPLLFLDEPTTGLDPQNRRALWSYLRELNRAGTTVFLTTQYMEEADVLTNRLAIIDQGRIRTEGSPESLKADLGGDVVTITLPAESTGEMRARAQTVLAELPGATRASAFDASFSVYLKDGSSRIADLVRHLDAAQVPVVRLELAEPSLDDVFLRVTGERMRVEEVKPPSRVGPRRRRRRG